MQQMPPIDHPQQTLSLRTVASGPEAHPQPEPPVAFTSASCAQHAPAPEGAGPPQQLAACVLRAVFGLVDSLSFVFMIISPGLRAGR